MLRLSAAQIARIDESELQDFVAHLTEGARRIVPDDVAHLSDDDLHWRVDVATRQALRSGLEIQRDVMLYVLATLWLEPDFPQNMPDLYEILANPGIPYDERRHWLAEARIDREIEEMGNERHAALALAPQPRPFAFAAAAVWRARAWRA